MSADPRLRVPSSRRHTTYNLPTRLPRQRSPPPVISDPENLDRPYNPQRIILSGGSPGSSLPGRFPTLEVEEYQLLVEGQIALIKRTIEQLGGPYYNHETIVAALARGVDLPPRRSL